MFRQISAFLYVGQLNRRFYEGYGVRDECLFPVPYAVDNDYFQWQAAEARQNRKSFRQSLGLDKNRPIILFAAKLISVKRPQDLLSAYRLLSPDGIAEPNPYVLFVGDGELRTQLEQEAKATGWSSIRFLGFYNQSQMPAIYDLCDVFVMASDFEPWGLAINEVMNAGKAVVVSDVAGCVPDLVHHQENGWIFPAGNVEELTRGIKWSLANAEIAGQKSLEIIQEYSFMEDIQGLKLVLQQIAVETKMYGHKWLNSLL